MGSNRRKFIKTAGLGVCTPAIVAPFSVQSDNALNIEFAFKAEVTVDKAVDLGVTQHGNRRIVPITGGSFEGPAIRGAVVPGGGDWQIIREDAVAELEARYTLRTNDGALIYVVNRGYRHGPPDVMQRLARGEPVDPSEYYFRATPVFETSADKYKWLTKYIFVATGERKSLSVLLNFYKIL